MDRQRPLFDWKAYMDSREMLSRPGVPPLSRPASPQKHSITLPDIPEALPGPNAFAQQAARMERHRLDSNAFYQQEVQRRTITPPTDVHPALRQRGTSDPPSPAPLAPPEQRGSTVTTMSSVINAGMEKSPLLKLVPSPALMQAPQPTLRGFIEDRHEQMVHELSGGEREGVPVYVYSPELSQSNFRESGSTPRKQRAPVPKKEVAIAEAPRSPKKSFFEKLRMTNLLGNTPSPSMSSLGSSTSAMDDSKLPPKAQAVLGASSLKANLGRSPSKPRKGLFSSRKSTDAADAHASKVSLMRKSAASEEEAPRATSTQAKTPQTAYSDPTHYSFQSGRRVAPHTLSKQGANTDEGDIKCIIQRSQSLKYFDHGPPPTPPAKNTPPNAKVQVDGLVTSSTRVPFHGAESDPPIATEGIVSTSDRLSPTRFGSYGHRETPKLVTKPSLYSMHASVVPELSVSFEEMKARVNSLGLEGFSMPAETQCHSNPNVVYTPSIYSVDWSARQQPIVPTPQRSRRYNFRQSQDILEEARAESGSPRTKKSGSSGETIEICYPEMGGEPSVNNLRPGVAALACPSNGNSSAEDDIPYHGRTHSRDHSNSPRVSMDASLFALPNNDNAREEAQASPASFNHPSAMPSPLHYVPDATYAPTVTHSDKPGATRVAGLGIKDRGRSSSGSPSRTQHLLNSVPSLVPHITTLGRSSPRLTTNDSAENDNVDVDPKKPAPLDQNTSKLNEMFEMLSRINARNEDMTSIRDEMRSNNARLDQRLDAIEHLQHTPPVPSSPVEENILQRKMNGHLDEHRVPTEFALDFYRHRTCPSRSANEIGSDASTTESDTIAELKETNRRLVEMVNDFAEKLDGMQKKMGSK